MKKFETAGISAPLLSDYLKEGWEPFGYDRGVIYLKRALPHGATLDEVLHKSLLSKPLGELVNVTLRTRAKRTTEGLELDAICVYTAHDSIPHVKLEEQNQKLKEENRNSAFLGKHVDYYQGQRTELFSRSRLFKEENQKLKEENHKLKDALYSILGLDINGFALDVLLKVREISRYALEKSGK